MAVRREVRVALSTPVVTTTSTSRPTSRFVSTMCVEGSANVPISWYAASVGVRALLPA